MLANLSGLINDNDIVAVATSGGSDSICLLHFLHTKSKLLNFKVIALNVEHGIRGTSSLNDTRFVKDFCKNSNIPLLTYSINALEKSKAEGLSIEEAARMLRYQCFFDAINTKKCTKVATAHHLKDNLETVLFNLFRGTGLKGVKGIDQNFSDKIIRPLINTSKEQIEEYIKEHSLTFVTDESNFDKSYSRNYIRLELLPKIYSAFPDAEKNVYRFSSIVKEEDEFLDSLARNVVNFSDNKAIISLPIAKVIFNRATIMALKYLGINKDWERVHIEQAFELTKKENGKMITLPKNVIAQKEYDKLVFYVNEKAEQKQLVFTEFIGKSFNFLNEKYTIEKLSSPPLNLKDGFYVDLDKIPSNCVIRTKKAGDTFTKFGGGTKSLSDFLTDKKIPLREREYIPLLACKQEILAIFNVAVSDKVKIDDSTKQIIKLL